MLLLSQDHLSGSRESNNEFSETQEYNDICNELTEWSAEHPSDSYSIDSIRGIIMSTIKIISNPYAKEIKFQKYDSNSDSWQNIDYEHNENSKLLRQELIKGFFPFNVKEIVDIIIAEYGVPGEKTVIVFQGTADEYRELEEICGDDAHKDLVSTTKEIIYLENARDILPLVRNLFSEMDPLIMKSANHERIERDLNRFKDAASDVVPICVLGNYSTGKSTFINALIGSEILPSGTEPVTAKIYKISRSKYPDRASVKFQYLGYDTEVRFTAVDTALSTTAPTDSFYEELRSVFIESTPENMSVRVGKVLQMVNDFENRDDIDQISDLIEVEIPFKNGVLANTQHPFVVFDTPGSNSASNAKHLMVLKEAMANMTNGLPIFLSTPEALDSTDNEDLYHLIQDMEELDSRFTMIVVNKADGPGLQRKDNSEAEKSRVLRQAVPRSLYSGGLFYVSSILGLGSKNGGDFIDDFYAELFEDQESKYSNPEHRRYKTLYIYNIMPDQIERRADELAAKQTDLLYANSGLFSVESQIEAFAGMYSAYNKCFQSQMFLNRVIDITSEDIEESRIEKEGIRQSINEKLDDDKKKLIGQIEGLADEQYAGFKGNYDEHMSQFMEGVDQVFSEQSLKEKEAELTAVQDKAKDYEGSSAEADNARSSLLTNLKANAGKLFREGKKENLTEAWNTAKADLAKTVDTYRAKREIRHSADRAVADQIMTYVRDRFVEKMEAMLVTLDLRSKEYWSAQTENLRKQLAQLITGADELTPVQKDELEQIIITYHKLEFEENEAQSIFQKENFERSIQILGKTIRFSDHLMLDKLAETYNAKMSEGVNTRYKAIKESHDGSAKQWIDSLLDEVRENIVNYSPELSKLADRIRRITADIEDHEKRQKKLMEYKDELLQMMNWKSMPEQKN